MGYEKKEIIEKSLSQLCVDPSVSAKLPLSKEPVIFLGLSIDYDHSSGKLADPIFKSKFALISEGLINERTEEGINLVQLIKELSGMLQSRFQYKDLCLDELEALQYLFQCWQGIESVSAAHLKWLNDIVPAFLGDLGLAEPWAAIILKDFIAHLIEQGDVCQCQHCGTFFPYQKGKKFCAPISDGRNCGKQVRNKRFYTEHQQDLRRKAKVTMAELRACRVFYRKKGVKKDC